MRLVELTKAYDNSNMRTPVYINPEYVIKLDEDFRTGGTTIWLVDGHVCNVAEEKNDVIYDLTEGDEDHDD